MANEVSRVCLLLVCLGTFSLLPGSVSEDKLASVDAHLKASHHAGLINGTALVAANGQVLYRRAFGLANLEWDIPNDLDTKFNVYSISKQFTAMLGMMMVAEGKLNLDGRLIDFLPWFRRDSGERILIRHLFSHTHGIPYVSYNSLPYRNKLDKAAFMKAHYSQDLAFEPGQGFAYGDGFDILAAVIEKVSGRDFEALLKERILIPLEMKNTGFWHARLNIPKRATDYTDSLEYKAEPLYEMPLNGSCALHSTVDDLFKWYLALRGNRLLEKRFQDEMIRVQADFGRPYGFGFDVEDTGKGAERRRLVWHEGSASTLFLWSVDDDLLVVLLNNRYGDNLRIGREILAILRR
jgi:CubicO group peptidase (beta-lactamase class C family)